MKKNSDELFAEYLESDPQKREILRRQMEEEGINFLELERLYSMMDMVPLPPSSEKMDKNFYRMLAEEKKKIQPKETLFNQIIVGWWNLFRHRYTLRLAYSLLLLAVGWFTGIRSNQSIVYGNQLNQMSAELADMKMMMTFTMLNQKSPVERMKAVHYIRTMTTVDDRLINALMNTLNRDSNVNVRLVALEALIGFTDRELVRKGLIHSINEQNSPILQITLVNTITSFPDEETAGQLKKLLQKKELNYSVRKQVEKNLNQLI